MSVHKEGGWVSQHALQVNPGGIPACLAGQSGGGGLVWGGGVGVSPIFRGEGVGGVGCPIFWEVSNFWGAVKGGPPNSFFWWGGEFFFDLCFLWGYIPPRDQTLEYGQRSAGTHPTGMHSCLLFLPLIYVFYLQFFHDRVLTIAPATAHPGKRSIYSTVETKD